jgi:hypothetical protein
MWMASWIIIGTALMVFAIVADNSPKEKKHNDIQRRTTRNITESIPQEPRAKAS